MALSQIQCLDDNHVNLRTHESKPEFLYCEDQRSALEALLRNGREAFFKCLEARGLRGFLSDPELETLAGSVQPYNPGLEVYPEDAEDGDPPLSQHYWPDLSDTSVPQMDLGWPDTESYRGVTRTNVYTQPPLDGHAHIKEILRKMITQAQKVIAVVMDVFTDVDIFRDLLDASFKKRVAVYILLEQTSLSHFLSMCQRANMHAGHLKNLRVRCTTGAEFLTRSSTKVKGQMGHRFMFIDGDKAVSGSYSFTWMSARLNKNHVTVVTGQAADTFDRLFRTLYSNSSSVDLRQVATEPEPEPEPVPQPLPVAPPSAAVARKLYNPKYALVALGNPATNNKNPQETEKPEDKNPEESSKKRRKRQREEALQEAPPIHPGLDLEKVCLMSYLPIWPEPDPPKDVIGFINIRDAKKPTQVHLQRSEMFETSQAIRFSSPFSMPKEILPEVAKPRQEPAKHEEVNKLRAAQDKTKVGESRVDRLLSNVGPGEVKGEVEAATQNSPKCELNKDTTKTPTNQSSGHNSAPDIDANTTNPPTSIPNPWMNRYKSQITTKTSPKSDFSPGSNMRKETETSSNTQASHILSNKEQHTHKQTVLPHLDSHSKAFHTQSQNSSKITPNIPTPTATTQVFSSSSPLSENNNSKPIFSPVPQLSSSSSPPPNPPLPTSPTFPTSAPPIPKPRTIQLLLKDGITSDGKKLLEGSAAKKSEMSTVVQNEFAAGAVEETLPKKQPEIVSVTELQNNKSASGKQGNVEGAVKLEESSQQKEDGASQKKMNKEAETNVKAQSDGLITEKPKVKSINKQEVTPNLASTSTERKLTTQTKQETKSPEKNVTYHEFANIPNENSTQGETNIEKEPAMPKISESASTPNNTCVIEMVDSTNTKNNAHNNCQEPKATREGKHTLEKSMHLPLFESHTPDLSPPAPHRESRWITTLTRTPTPDGLSSPDLRSHTPDFRTLTPDVSDGYVSALEDSNLSTTSEEYYECSASPCLLELGLDGAANPGQGISEEYVSFALTSIPKATNLKKCETQSLPVPSNASSSFFLKKEEKKKEDREKATSKDNKKEEAERKEAASQGAGVRELRERVERKKDAPSQVPKRKKVLNQSAADKFPDGGANEGAEPKRLSTGDPKPKTGAEKEKGASVVMRREKPNKETETQKIMQTLLKPSAEQPQKREAFPPPRPSRPLSGQYLGPRPWGSGLLSNTESALHHGSLQVLGNASSPHKLPPQVASGILGSAAARGQSGISRSQHNLLADGLKPRASLLHTISQPHLSVQAQNLSANHKVEGRSPFSFTFSRLYSLKDLKDKMSKLPGPGRRSSNSSPLQERKSTS